MLRILMGTAFVFLVSGVLSPQAQAATSRLTSPNQIIEKLESSSAGVPEPAFAALIGGGLIGLASIRRKRRP